MGSEGSGPWAVPQWAMRVRGGVAAVVSVSAHSHQCCAHHARSSSPSSTCRRVECTLLVEEEEEEG